MTTTMPPPPRAPRPLTDKVRHRILMEPRVRGWWLAGLALLAISAFFAVTRLIEWSRVRWLVHNGTPAIATIWQIGEDQAEMQSNASPDTIVYMYYFPDDLMQKKKTHSDDEKTYISGFLDGRTEPINLHDANGDSTTVPIKVDPGEPTLWTYRNNLPPLAPQFLSALLVLLPAIGCLVVAYLVREKVKRIWTEGAAREFAVVSSHQTAAAPRSRVISCTALDGTDSQPIKVVVPMRLGDPQPGQLLWLIFPAGKPTAAIPAISYQ